LPENLEIPVLLKVGDNVSTDEILPAGARVLPFRSNVEKISEFAFEPIDATYPRRATAARARGGHTLVAGDNYGQGSSREHAALAPRFLGLRLALAKGFARIHWQNLVNFGVLPLTFCDAEDYQRLALGDCLTIENISEQLVAGSHVVVRNATRSYTMMSQHEFSARQIAILRAGGLINWVKSRH
jgi:aconitate hydratase